MTASPLLHDDLTLLPPDATLGHQVAELVRRCPPLDTNSTYCNLLQCHHFAQTACAAVTADKELVGFVSGYLIPAAPDTLFIWQVAVDSSQRGRGLGPAMIRHILARPVCESTRFIETTVTDTNQASIAMFAKLAATLGAADIETRVLFDRQRHFLGLHDSETLLRIGPFHHA